MAIKRALEYKPLLYTTTMRNPERLKFMLYVLNKFEGQTLDDALATTICGETIRYGLYRPMKRIPNNVQMKWKTVKGTFGQTKLTDNEVKEVLYNNDPTRFEDIKGHKEMGFSYGWPSRFATIFDLMKELGLAYFWPGEPIIISELGKHLINAIEVQEDGDESNISFEVCHPEYEQQVFLQAMAKSQRKNPFVRVLNDNIPLILLLQTILMLNNDSTQNGSGISRQELPLLIFWKNNNAQELYKRIVLLRKKYGYSPSDEVIIDICTKEIMNDFKEFKPNSIMTDYPDEFIRKMRMTGLISLRGAGRFIDINKNETQKVEYILKHYASYHEYSDEREYFDYMAQLDLNLISIQAKPVPAGSASKLLSNWLTIYKWTDIKKELMILSSKGSSKDSVLKLLSAPSRLEFLTALAIKTQLPHVDVIPNYCCDDTGLPTSTAGGNKGDIECFEYSNGILVEVTMAEGRTQTMMEVWPISRHLDDFISNNRCKSQCVFVAPTIFSDTSNQIEWVRDRKKQNIRPYPIKDFISFLDSANRLYQ